MANKTYEAESLNGKLSTSVDVSVTNSGITVAQGRRKSETYGWDEIAEIEVEGPDTVQKRVTVSRVLLTGVFALAIKKKSGEAFLFISFHDNREPIVLRFPKKSQPELKAIIAPYRNRISKPTQEEQVHSSQSGNPTQQIEELADLLAKKLITEDEFKKSKARILGI